MAMPLLQTNFFPDLTHVYVFDEANDVIPALVHVAPAFTAAFAGNCGKDNERARIDKTAKCLLLTLES